MTTINGKAFVTALRTMAKTCEKKNTLPILSHVLLQSESGKLTLTATDLEVGVSVTLTDDDPTATTAPPWSLTCPVKALQAACKGTQAKGRTVTLAPGETSSPTVRTLRVNACELLGFAASEYPAVPDYPSEGKSIEGLAEACAMALPACTTDETRFAVQGILLDVNIGAVVATDGHRLVKVQIPAIEGGPRQILPRKTSSLLSTLSGPIVMARDDKHIFFACSNIRIISRVLEGVFPQYDKVIPQNHPRRVPLSPELRQAMIASAAPLPTSDHTNAVRYTIDPELQTLTMIAKSPEFGSGTATLPLPSLPGWPALPAVLKAEPSMALTLAFNRDYMADCLALPVDTWHVKDSDSQSRFSGPNIDVIIMPMRA